MPSTSTYTATGDAYVDGLLYGTKWGVTSFTYSFPTDPSFYGTAYGSGEPINAFKAFTAQQQTAVTSILQGYSAVANVTFTQVTESATTHADFRYAESNTPYTAWAYFPTTNAIGGDAWFNNSSGWYNSPVMGNYAWLTMMHETGHAMGLKHPQDVIGAFGVLPADKDSLEYSVMSYRSYIGASTSGGYTNASDSYPQTLMMYDIAALQVLYGADYATNSGNTVYKWDPLTGQEFVNGVGQTMPAGNKIFMTTWDGGGSDTYDFSNYTTSLGIDLRPGFWTTTSATQLANLGGGHTAIGNIANALLYNNNTASLIENAIGGSAADSITGNDANNVLTGGGGSDTENGGAGSDTAVFSGAAADYSRVQNSDGSWTVTDLRAGSPDGTDTLVNIEFFQFSDGVVPAVVVINHAPTDLALSGTATVPEGTAIGTVVGSLSATDQDAGETFTYQILNNAGGMFGLNGSNLVVAGPLNYEGASSLAVTVRVTDSANNTFDKVFNIAVTDVAPTAPTDSNATSNSVVEGAAAGTLVGITAVSTDINGGAVTFSLSDNAGGRFAIDAVTGVVTVADGAFLNFETAQSHTIVVKSSDASGAFTTQSFTVGVTDSAPNAPTDENVSPNTVAEGAATGTLVGITATATDVGGGAITFSLTDSAGGRFTIDPVTGVVTVANGALINFEDAQSHSIVVKAADASGAFTTQSFVVEVTDVAPPTPADSDATINTVASGAATGTYVGITATAPDINGGAVTFSLANNSDGRFAIDAVTGVVTVADGSLINSDLAQSYSIVVKASDPSGAFSTETFSIGVNDAAPHTPTDNNAAPNTVAEGAATGTLVGITATATDVGGGAITFSLTDSAGGRFTIDPVTGVVTVANGALINFEDAQSHSIVVKAADASGAFSTQSFVVEVTDVAPPTPADSNATINTVASGAATGTLVGITATATDVNGGTVTFSLANNSDGRFAIDAVTGVVTVADGSLINSDLAQSYSIVVKASDPSGAFSTETFSIGVTPALGVTITGTASADTIDTGHTAAGQALPTNLCDTINGGGGNDIIYAYGGNDTINGGAGSDKMYGGTGNDTYVVDAVGDVVSENADAGIDSVKSSVTYTLGANVENLTLTGTGTISGTGNAGVNTIVGNAGANTLAGLGGADALDGAGGTDTATYAASSAGVNVSLATGTGTGGDADGDTLVNIENLIGSSADDVLEGNSGTNKLTGGANTAAGDTVSYEHAGSAVTVSLANTNAQATGGAGSDTLSGFENLTGSAFNDKLTGTSGANVLRGLDGNDTISAGGGADTLIGGNGTDKLTGGAGADAFVFNFPSQGMDTITDFASGSDFIGISVAGFGGNLQVGGAATLFSVADFSAASGAGSDGYFIFDNSGSDAGTVYYDATGGTSEDAIALFKVQTGGSVVASDFHLI